MNIKLDKSRTYRLRNPLTISSALFALCLSPGKMAERINLRGPESEVMVPLPKAALTVPAIDYSDLKAPESGLLTAAELLTEANSLGAEAQTLEKATLLALGSVSRVVNTFGSDITTLRKKSTKLQNELSIIDGRADMLTERFEILSKLQSISPIDPSGFWPIWYLNTVANVDSLGITRSAKDGSIEYSPQNVVISIRHYLDHGLPEGKPASIFFDPKFYSAAYPDVRQSCPNGHNLYDWAYRHWARIGAPEGRDGSGLFGANRYLDSQPALAEHLSSSVDLAYKHFVWTIFNELNAKPLIESWVGSRPGPSVMRSTLITKYPSPELMTDVLQALTDIVIDNESCNDSIRDLAISTIEATVTCAAAGAFPNPVTVSLCTGTAGSMIVNVVAANGVCISESLVNKQGLDDIEKKMNELSERTDKDFGADMKEGVQRAQDFDAVEKISRIA